VREGEVAYPKEEKDYDNPSIFGESVQDRRAIHFKCCVVVGWTLTLAGKNASEAHDA
jgi:hypothetical protein